MESKFQKHFKNIQGLKSLIKKSLIAGVTLTLVGCSLFTSYKEETTKCENLLATRDSLEEVYNEIDFEELIKIGEAATEQMDSIKHMLNSNGTTLSKEDAIFLGRYRSVSKPYRKLAENRQKIEFDLRLSKKQLEDLLKDISNKSVPKDSVMLFLDSETEAVLIVQSNIEELKRSKSSVEEEFNKDQDEIKRIFKVVEGK